MSAIIMRSLLLTGTQKIDRRNKKMDRKQVIIEWQLLFQGVSPEEAEKRRSENQEISSRNNTMLLYDKLIEIDSKLSDVDEMKVSYQKVRRSGKVWSSILFVLLACVLMAAAFIASNGMVYITVL